MKNAPSNVHSIHKFDQNRSSVGEEVDAMDWQFGKLFQLLTELEKQPEEAIRTLTVKEARRRLNTVVQRAFRAKQIARGLRVPKAN